MNAQLRQVSVDYLYPGMDVTEDIFDADGRRLLLPAGGMLSSEDYERIEANCTNGNICVTHAAFSLLAEHKRQKEQMATPATEARKTYTAAVDNTIDLLRTISATTHVPVAAVHTVCENISEQVKTTEPNILFDLINALAPVDEYLQRHIIHVAMINGMIGRWLDFPPGEVDKLILIGLLHDAGKAVIPPEILGAPRRLTVAEFEVMKMHPVYGYELLTAFDEEVRLGVLYHHEKIDGSGYPNRVALPGLPLSARITTISDIYDAMISRRSYKPPASPFKAIQELLKLCGLSLDARIVDRFLANIPGEFIGKSVLLSDGRVGRVHALDVDDIAYPMVEVDGNVVKSNSELFCVCMYGEEG